MSPDAYFCSARLRRRGVFYMACCIPQIGAGARVSDGNVKKKCLILASRVAVEECPRLRCCVHT